MTRTLAWTGLALAASLCASHAQEISAPEKAKAVEAEAALHVPGANYRGDWVQLGAFSVLADKPADGAKQLHVVYTERKNIDAYLATGAFPEGAVLVKDVYAAKTEALTTGVASYAGELAGRFVLVKDKSSRSPRFGDGWGWAFYEGTETKLTATTNYKKDCLGCHEPARATDLVYVQGYPILRK
ncbi:cytochrome P460 family protein [Methylosinus sp. LW4]|uniref:cytochrome P460 family protein n=1 Tax=Methylosinus sp. LW4 TaxID=136993 RepID=UPI0003A5ECFB|nr:cytochrome P460 family protein [Methylosinus sp. LW4]